MQPYLRTRQQQDKRARTTGLVVTGVVHALAAVICLTAGLKYLDPPPPETSFVIDFEEDVLEPETPVQTRIGRQPQAEETDPTKAVELVQKAESPYVNDRPNTTPATRPDPHGDVEVPTPKQEEPKLDPRASFPGMSQKDDKARPRIRPPRPRKASRPASPTATRRKAGRPVTPMRTCGAGTSWEPCPSRPTTPRWKEP